MIASLAAKAGASAAEDCWAVLRFAGRRKDRARGAFEFCEPGRDVGGVIKARVMRDAEIGEDEAAQNLDADFFGGVTGGTEAAAEVAVETVERSCAWPLSWISVPA
jgi:hypothetical protein